MRRISHLLVVLAAAITLLVAPTRALAANYPTANQVYVNRTSQQSSWPSGVSYNPSTGTLTLNNATVRSISVDREAPSQLTIRLIGDNRMTTDEFNNTYTILIENSGSYDVSNQANAQIIFAGTGSLTLTGYQVKNGSDAMLCGICAGGQVTFQDSCTVNIVFNMKSGQSWSDYTLVGVETYKGDIVVKDSAAVNMTFKAVSAGQAGAAFWFNNSLSGNYRLRVSSTRGVSVDASNISPSYSITGFLGISTRCSTPLVLERPASVTIKAPNPFNGHDGNAGDIMGYNRSYLSSPYGVSYSPVPFGASWVNDISNVTYDGTTRKMPVSVIDLYATGGARWLVEGTDFTTTYSGDLVNVGTVTVKVTGIGKYAGGSTVTKTYQILPKNVGDSDVTLGQVFDQTYRGSQITPDVRLTYKGMQLVKGTDYTLTYYNNVEIGTATILVRGAGNYTGVRYVYFDIVEGYTGVPMYRYYNPWSGEHFYSCDFQERNALVDAGWRSEGIGWYAPPSSGTPVYRLYNPWASGGDHHYTTSWSEYQSCIAAGWKGEGVGWYSDDAHSVSVWREYNPYQAAHNHNYTADYSEHQHLLSVGWRDEGVGWYGVNPPTGPVG